LLAFRLKLIDKEERRKRRRRSGKTQGDDLFIRLSVNPKMKAHSSFTVSADQTHYI